MRCERCGGTLKQSDVANHRKSCPSPVIDDFHSMTKDDMLEALGSSFRMGDRR